MKNWIVESGNGGILWKQNSKLWAFCENSGRSQRDWNIRHLPVFVVLSKLPSWREIVKGGKQWGEIHANTLVSLVCCARVRCKTQCVVPRTLLWERPNTGDTWWASITDNPSVSHLNAETFLICFKTRRHNNQLINMIMTTHATSQERPGVSITDNLFVSQEMFQSKYASLWLCFT